MGVDGWAVGSAECGDRRHLAFVGLCVGIRHYRECCIINKAKAKRRNNNKEIQIWAQKLKPQKINVNSRYRRCVLRWFFWVRRKISGQGQGWPAIPIPGIPGISRNANPMPFQSEGDKWSVSARNAHKSHEILRSSSEVQVRLECRNAGKILNIS